MSGSSRSIQSVARAMRLLEHLGARGGSARLSELADDMALARSTVHGLLDTLVALGYVTRSEGRYASGPRLEAIARPLDESHARLRRTFAPALRAFNELCGETAILAVPGGARAYVTLAALDREGRPQPMECDEQRDALETSAAGKTFLAHHAVLARRLRLGGRLSPALETELVRIGEVGYALDVQASRSHLNCVALPLRMQGRVVATVSASGPSDRLDPAFMRRLARRSMRQLFDVLKS